MLVIGMKIYGELTHEYKLYSTGKRYIELGLITELSNKCVYIEGVKCSRRVVENNIQFLERRTLTGSILSTNILSKFITKEQTTYKN